MLPVNVVDAHRVAEPDAAMVIPRDVSETGAVTSSVLETVGVADAQALLVPAQNFTSICDPGSDPVRLIVMLLSVASTVPVLRTVIGLVTVLAVDVYVKGPSAVIVPVPPEGAVLTAMVPAVAVAVFVVDAVQAANPILDVSERKITRAAVIDIRVERFMPRRVSEVACRARRLTVGVPKSWP
jgi:hypothetical protein